MEDEILELLRDHCVIEASDEDIEEAFDVAIEQGYSDGIYSNNPQELIAFIDGFILGKKYHRCKDETQTTKRIFKTIKHKII
jgi:hypothetical protein